MKDLLPLFKDCIVKNESKTKAICAPLQKCLGIPLFAYYCINDEGNIVNLSNNAAVMESYYQNKCYMRNPHAKHPRLMHSGSLFVPQAYYPPHLQLVFKQHQINGMLLLLNCHEDFYEGFCFATKEGQNSTKALFANIEVFHSFARFFTKAAKPMIEKAKSEKFNIKHVSGDAFLESDSSTPLSNNDPSTQKFLKMILPLTRREQQCLELFKQGKSAQATGAVLGLSQRTVESYFENIKNKLGCHSKGDLLGC